MFKLQKQKNRNNTKPHLQQMFIKNKNTNRNSASIFIITK